MSPTRTTRRHAEQVRRMKRSYGVLRRTRRGTWVTLRCEHCGVPFAVLAAFWAIRQRLGSHYTTASCPYCFFTSDVPTEL